MGITEFARGITRKVEKTVIPPEWGFHTEHETVFADEEEMTAYEAHFRDTRTLQRAISNRFLDITEVFPDNEEQAVFTLGEDVQGFTASGRLHIDRVLDTGVAAHGTVTAYLPQRQIVIDFDQITADHKHAVVDSESHMRLGCTFSKEQRDGKDHYAAVTSLSVSLRSESILLRSAMRAVPPFMAVGLFHHHMEKIHKEFQAGRANIRNPRRR